MSKQVLIMFGGISPEHEVSVITGLQVIENIDKEAYQPLAIYVTKNGSFKYLKNLNTRRDFKTAKQTEVKFGTDENGGFIEYSEGFSNKKVYPYSVYLAFHGGVGENGSIQGMLESLKLPFTSSTKEASTIAMNKQLTKEQASASGVNTVPGISLFSKNIKDNIEHEAKKVLEHLSLPVIVKPVHLGSSIAIKVAKTTIELEKYLLEASFVDSEILVEKFLEKITEYNCSVRLVNNKLEASEVEKPMSKDEILSFADKYQRGGKKTSTGNGMASLQRELPANISEDLKELIQGSAKKAFVACRCKGMVRIDFMYSENKLYLTEINPIPGSMAFYLWEASGIQFKQQITDLIEQSIVDFENQQNTVMDYTTDIIDKFVNNK